MASIESVNLQKLQAGSHNFFSEIETVSCDSDSEMARGKGNVAGRIRLARQRMGLTQAEFAARLGVERGAVGNWEAGKRSSEENLKKIAEISGVSFEWLYLGLGDPPAIMREIERARRLAGLSVDKLAEETTINRTRITAAEEGADGLTEVESARLAARLQVPAGRLLKPARRAREVDGAGLSEGIDPERLRLLARDLLLALGRPEAQAVLLAGALVAALRQPPEEISGEAEEVHRRLVAQSLARLFGPL